MLLELKDINKSYFQGKQEMPVLKNVNFSVEEGEYVAIRFRKININEHYRMLR